MTIRRWQFAWAWTLAAVLLSSCASGPWTAPPFRQSATTIAKAHVTSASLEGARAGAQSSPQPYPDERTWWSQVAYPAFDAEYRAVGRHWPDEQDPLTFVWPQRTAFDIALGMTREASLAKHLAELHRNLNPPPDPVVDFAPPWTGQLRKARDDLGYQDAAGAWTLPVCAHYGEAFSAFVHGKTIAGVDVEEQLRRIKSAGYDCIRFWDILGFYDSNRPDQSGHWVAWKGAEVTPYTFVAYSGRTIAATPGYYEQLRDFIGLLRRLGLTAFHSRGDLNAIPFARVLQHTQRVAAIYDELGAWPTLALAEANNENFQNGSFTPEQLRRIVEPFKVKGVLTAHSTAALAEEPAAIAEISAGASIYTVHGLRVGTFSQILEHIFSLGYFPRQPDWTSVPRLGVQGEPTGPGDGVSVGRVNERELLGLMAATSLMSRQWWVYMSGHGVFWKGAIEPQPGFAVVPRIRKAIADFAPTVMSWDLYHGARVEAALRSPTGYEGDPGNVNGPARIFNAVRPDRRMVVAVVEGGHGAKKVQNKLPCVLQLSVIKVNDDETLGRHEFQLKPDESLPIDYRFGRLLLGKCSTSIN